MFLAGLWHGAAWTFVVWGLFHGVLLGTHGLLRKLGLTPSSVFFNRAVTFLFVVAAFVIFRAPHLGTAGTILSSMLGFGGLDHAGALHTFLPARFLILLGALLVFVHAAPNTWQIRARPRIVYGLATGTAAAIAIMTIASPHPFIYFQF